MENAVHSVYFSKDTGKKSNHYHNCHQIIFVTKGCVEIYVNKTRLIADEGKLVMLSRYENHSVNIVSDVYERFVLRLNPFNDGIDYKEYSLLLNRPHGFVNIFDVSEFKTDFEQLFARIVEEQTSKNIMIAEMQNSLISQLLIMIYRLNPENYSCFDEEKFDIIFKIQHQFEENCKIKYSLSELSQKYHVSISTLSHQFKKITGFSVFEYLYFCRIATAKHLLAKTDLSIGEIVEMSGFSDNSNFSRSFKKDIGMKPSEFRKKYKSKRGIT